MHDYNHDVVGACSQCGDSLSCIQDLEGRKWARCTRCGAQFPLEQGRPITGELSDKAVENSLQGVR